MTDSQFQFQALLTRLVYVAYIIRVNRFMARIMRAYAESVPQVCHWCHKPVRRSERSVDHLVPKRVCKELDWFGLLIDERNFVLAHKLCNTIRGDDISQLPQSVQDKINERRKELYGTDVPYISSQPRDSELVQPVR